MVAFPHHNTFSLFIFWNIWVILIWTILLEVDPIQRPIKRKLNVHIISNILIHLLLISEDLIRRLRIQKCFCHCLFFRHFFIIVITSNFFNFILELGHQDKHFCKFVKQCIWIRAVIGCTVHVIDMSFSS